MKEDRKKAKIISYLKRGNYVSGEELSRLLSLSRTSIWKKVEGLRKEGYKILGSPRLGYKLAKLPDLLLPEEIREGLKTEKFGRDAYHYHELDSTVRIAKSLAERKEKEGAIVVAERQSKGKGRLERSWASPSGGIWLSLILYPDMMLQSVFKLTILSSVALAAVLESLGLNPSIKWPNDIQILDKKVAGILTEVDAELDKVTYAILSMGINVNVDMKSFPKDLRPKVATVKECLGKSIDRVEFLKKLLEELEKNYKSLGKKDFELVFGRWKKLLDTLGKEVKVSILGEELEGKAVGVDENGALLLKVASGKTEKIYSGDITYLNSKL